MIRLLFWGLFALTASVAARQPVDPHFKIEKLADGVFAAVRQREYLPGKGLEARKQMMQGAPNFANDLRGFLKSGKSPAGGDLTSEERAAFESDVAMIDRYAADTPSFDVVLPTITVEDKMTLYRGSGEATAFAEAPAVKKASPYGSRPVVIQSVGAGHTPGDLVAYLPADGILATGDLVVAPIPLVGGDQSHIASWIGALDRISALHPATILPGHGPIMHDDSYVKQMAGAFRAIKDYVDAAVARGETLEQIQKNIKLDDWRVKFAGDSSLRRAVFRNYFGGPAVIAAFREAKK